MLKKRKQTNNALITNKKSRPRQTSFTSFFKKMNNFIPTQNAGCHYNLKEDDFCHGTYNYNYTL